MKSTRMAGDTICDIGRAKVDCLAEVVERALGYPYGVPSHSFILDGGRARDLPPAALELQGRKALLAFGSNAAPEVLARKLGASGRAVPVVRAILSDFDVVYSAHVTAYGSVPAAIQSSPGTEAVVFVVYLTEDQLRLMSETEPNYALGRLHDVSCKLDTGDSLSEAFTYVSRHGCLLVDGSEVALSSVEAHGRRFPSMSEPQVLEHVRATLSPEQGLEDFIAANVARPERARQCTDALSKTARPLHTAAKRRRAKRAISP
jgi:hypothetical protein